MADRAEALARRGLGSALLSHAFASSMSAGCGGWPSVSMPRARQVRPGSTNERECDWPALRDL